MVRLAGARFAWGLFEATTTPEEWSSTMYEAALIDGALGVMKIAA